MKRDANWVAEQQDPTFLYFWGHRPRKDGSLGPSCLSQWWPCSFEVDGVAFATAEHYMMWAKAMLSDDRETAAAILATPDPRDVKALGRQVRDYDDARWVEARYDAVVRGNRAKFEQDPALRDYLLGTGDAVLVEASPVDRVWGIGLAADDPAAADPARWRGENLLGFALMEVRDALTRPA